jgi:non-specific protein-tyrosine kinase
MFDHPNVIRIYGVAAMQEPLMLVMELASEGALDSYLRKNEVNSQCKSSMCAGASFGLEYLHNACKVIHRDIAARNCLYGGGQVKISDFGLTREGPVYQMNPSKRVPIRWLAPETLRGAIYSQASDVYSYGILCHEIWNSGLEPYTGK